MKSTFDHRFQVNLEDFGSSGEQLWYLCLMIMIQDYLGP